MSQTLLLSGADRVSSSLLNLHYSPVTASHHDHLSHLSQKHSPWTSQSSSMMESAQSFTARRPAATNLPQFQLPPPDHLHNKFPAFAPSNPSGPGVNSVLTPPAGLPNDLSPLASSVNSNGSTPSSNSGAGGGAPSYQPNNPMGYWPSPQNPAPSYAYSSAPSLATSYAQNQNYMNRQLYSPTQFPNRSATSPSTGEGLPQPPYEMSQLPPFPTNMSSSAGGQSQQNLPNLAPQQQQQSQMQSSQAPQQSPLHAPDNYGGRPPPTPSYYGSTPSSTPQQASFPAFAQHSPTQQSPNTSGPSQSRISPVSAHPMQPPQYQPRPYNGGYNLPAMSGPIMSNVHNPGNQMALVGGSMQQMQYAPQHMFGHHPQQPQNDRPFKCDQCPQSFNRNHDLKRHKRIHLAVKPFPCTHCEKSFSRKDALKVSKKARFQ
jgi:hypothetical protein